MAIHGELVTLRAVEREDAPALHRWLNDPRVMAGWGAPDHTVSLAETQRRIEGYLADEAAQGRPACLVVETLDGEPVGQVVLSQIQSEARSAELSLMIGEPDRWGEGLGTDALWTALAACFDAWGFHRVWLRSEAPNARAHRLYRRCGLSHEGTLREAAYLDGHFEDVLLFGILDREWRRIEPGGPAPSVVHPDAPARTSQVDPKADDPVAEPHPQSPQPFVNSG